MPLWGTRDPPGWVMLVLLAQCLTCKSLMSSVFFFNILIWHIQAIKRITVSAKKNLKGNVENLCFVLFLDEGSAQLLVSWIAFHQSRWRGAMFPCQVTPWPSAEPPNSCSTHGSSAHPSQPLPDLLCSCPPPQAHILPETPSPAPMESIIVVTEYETSRPPGGAEEEQVGGLMNLSSVLRYLFM